MAKIIAIIFFVAYPFFVYFGLQVVELKTLALLVLLLLAVRVWLQQHLMPPAQLATNAIGEPFTRLLWWPVSIAGGVLIAAVLLLDDALYLKFYPVLMNVLFFILFAGTLRHPPSMIERFARLKTPVLPAEAIAYTRKVTLAWCGFFLLNGLIAFYTVLFATMEIWMLYNGLIAYVLMSGLFLGEFVARYFVKKRHNIG